MNRFRVVAMFFCFGLVASLMPSRATANEYNKQTMVTFNEPVEVPGVDAQILPAGTYMFKLLDSDSDRNIVQILDPEGTHVYTTILAIANYRMHTTDKTVITFAERPAGTPPAIRAWFYPGDEWGQEFVYPKQRAIVLAKLNNQPVLAVSDELITAPVATLKTAPVEAISPAGEELPVAAVTQPEKPAPAPAAEVLPETLPQTASRLPLFALIGLVSLGLGIALLALSKRSA